MTPNDCLLVAICFMAASLLIRVTEPVLDYILAVIVVFLYYVLGALFPFTLVFLSLLGASLASFIYDVESNRWKLAATAFGMLTLTLLIGLVRLLWSYIHVYYAWTIDIGKLAAALTGIPRSGVQFCFICAVVLTLLGCWVELFQQSVFGINPYAQLAEAETVREETSQTSDTQPDTAGNIV